MENAQKLKNQINLKIQHKEQTRESTKLQNELDRELIRKQVEEENLIALEHKRLKQQILKDAWTEQEEQRKLKDKADKQFEKLLL